MSHQFGFTLWLQGTFNNRSGTPTTGDTGTTVLVVYRGADRESGVSFSVPEAQLIVVSPGVWSYGWVPTSTGDQLVEWRDFLTVDGIAYPRGNREIVTITEV